VPVFFRALRRVVLPTDFELSSEDFPIKLDRPVGNVGRNRKMADSWHALCYIRWCAA
jgi:hypothetical protein